MPGGGALVVGESRGVPYLGPPEIDEEEYWRRLSVLEEQFGRVFKDSAA